MKNILLSMTVTLAGFSLLASSQPPSTPRQLPSGHPAVSIPTPDPKGGERESDPADGSSINALVNAYDTSNSAG